MSDTAGPVHAHAVVWIDHLVAKIFSVGVTGVHARSVRARLSARHLRHKPNEIGSSPVQQDAAFLANVSECLEGCTDLLILGPGTEKIELMHYLKAVKPELSLELEPIDHSTDREIVALARKRFHLD
ncbi:hypothetical protein JQ615_06350 [Bradyrhizobium jicamae]|uniref:Translational machinery protein n=1 Tax=Bradyrhizobium jicamae TaxID=280332 RepID=A0ABS5FDX7_9BRAD|nr:hypothetical protein [Bradyrhizobium jicamae]MBR0795002.1 hypothetical protein [Bradyrhizobium jicamae]